MKKAKGFIEIDRDEDFVHRGGHRSGWKDGHKSMSDYLLDGEEPRTAEAQIKELYSICRNRSDNMGVGSNHKLFFSPKEATGRTDGKNVFVSTKVMDEKKPFSEKVDIMLGITTHEMAHIQHTDFPMMKKEIKNRFIHSVWNTVEDERIEHIVGEEYPGYADNIAATKKYFFDEKYLLEEAMKKGKKLKTRPKVTVPGKKGEEEEEIPEHLIAEEPRELLTEELTDPEKDAVELYDTIFKFIRYPKHIDVDIASKYETELDEVKKILTPYPTTCAESIMASKKVAHVIKKKIEDDMDDDKAAEGIMEALGGMMEAMTSVNEDDMGGGTVPSESASKYDYMEEYIEDKDWKAVFRKGTPNKEAYLELLNEVKGDARRLANVLYTKVFSETKYLKGMRTGDLDDTKIIEGIHGVKTVHLAKIPKVSKKLNIGILVDESGSMAGSKARDAAKVAILIQEAFRIFPVGQLFIYGFTGDYCATGDYADYDFNTVFRYVEPGLDVKYGLGDVRGRSQNRDGHCIRAAATRMRTFTSDPIIYFIISDGQPAASHYGGTGGIKDTRAAVTEVSKKRFFPIQIGIEEGIPVEVQRQMFDDFVNYKTSRQMVDEIRKLLLKKAHKIAGI